MNPTYMQDVVRDQFRRLDPAYFGPNPGSWWAANLAVAMSVIDGVVDHVCTTSSTEDECEDECRSVTLSVRSDLAELAYVLRHAMPPIGETFTLDDRTGTASVPVLTSQT